MVQPRSLKDLSQGSQLKYGIFYGSDDIDFYALSG